MPQVKVKFTAQQLTLIRHMAEETADVRPVEEITQEMFRQYAAQMLGREYKK